MRGIGFGWLQQANAWLLHARLKIHRGGLRTRRGRKSGKVWACHDRVYNWDPILDALRG
eukprot:COSAG01_NODE_714_length_14097_cov_6.044435_13_plen_59_part_00